MSGRGNGPAVIFDLDGVIVDSEIWWDEVRAEFARRHDRDWTVDDREAVMGANSREWSRTMRDRLGLSLAPEEIEREVVDGVIARYGGGAPTVDGAVEAVRRIAAGHRVAIASSAHREVIETALETTGLRDLFEVVVSSDEVPAGKPAPDVYLEAARRLGVDAAECVVVEDSLNGVRAARAAGMAVVLVPNRTIPPQSGARQLADVVVDRLADLDPRAVDRSTAPSHGGSRRRSPSTGPERPRRPPIRGNVRRLARYLIARLIAAILVGCTVRLVVEGRDRLPAGPAVYCFNHLNWSDPFFLMAALPVWPQLYFFGPKEEDMGTGARNRLMSWSGTTVPYKPGKNDLLEATRRVEAILDGGGVLGIMGEGRIHARESELLPLNEGAAYFALRAGVPVVPIALNGTSWLRFGGRVRVRIGEPIEPSGRPTRARVDALTDELWHALHALVADHPEVRPPGRFGRWLTERFNDWPEGSRPD